MSRVRIHVNNSTFLDSVVRDGRKIDVRRPISSAREWQTFERLLTECLEDLGYEVLQIDPSQGQEPDAEARYDIFAHKGRRDAEGDLFYKQMHLKDLFTIDRSGWGVDHSGMQESPAYQRVDPERAAAFCGGLTKFFLETGNSKHPQPERLRRTSLPDDYVFVPLQKPKDYVLVHHSPIAVNDFVRLMASWASLRRQDVVFKLHPDRKSPDTVELTRSCAERFSHVHLVMGNVHDLVRWSKGVFAINSGVGFESLIHGKPVVNLGDCDYKWATFRACSETLDDALRYVSGYGEDQRRAAWQFVYYYCLEHGYLIDEARLETSRRRLAGYLEETLGAAK